MSNNQEKITIEKIHSDFKSVDSKVKIELERTNSIDKEKVEALKELGFHNFKEARQSSPEEIKKQQEKVKLVESYRVIAPNYKFVPTDEWIALCQKYGLIWGHPSYYIDSIPKKVQDSILNFKIADNSFLETLENSVNRDELETLRSTRWVTQTGKETTLKTIESDHLLNVINFCFQILAENNDESYRFFIQSAIVEFMCRGGDVVYGNEGNIHLRLSVYNMPELGYRVVSIPYFIKKVDVKSVIQSGILKHQRLDTAKGQPQFVICAAKHMFDLEDKTVTDEMEIIERPRPLPTRLFFEDDDPIAAVKVKGGFLIVDAWGPEAEHTEAINHFLN